MTGLYVHIPFCDHICGYCDFARQIYHRETVDQYLNMLSKEIEAKNLKDINTIYIGGGTPSSLSVAQLKKLFQLLAPIATEVVEYTIEVNPESMSLEKAALFSEYGINRVSMGLQVTQAHLLKIVERQHNIEEVTEAIGFLKRYKIDNISVDLMYGIPKQTILDWQESLAIVAKLDITHLSLYALTIEKGSKFYKKGYLEADADLDADMYEMAQQKLTKANFIQYEVSNFAKKGYESLHNKIYWRYQDFHGVGLNAASKIQNIRYNNTWSMDQYLAGDFLGASTSLSLKDQEFEYIMMNLRLLSGINLQDFKKRYKVDFLIKYQESLAKLKQSGLIEVNNESVYCTKQGLMLLHDVLEEFLI